MPPQPNSLLGEIAEVLFLKKEASLRANALSLAAAILVWSGMAIALAGPLALVISIFRWAKFGSWAYCDNAIILRWFDGLNAWLLHPHSWQGMHAIASWIFHYLPVGFLSIPIGLIVAIGGAVLLANTNDKSGA